MQTVILITGILMPIIGWIVGLITSKDKLQYCLATIVIAQAIGCAIAASNYYL